MPRLFRVAFLIGALVPRLAFSQAMDDIATTDEDTQVVFGITANDVDPDGLDLASVDLDLVLAGRQVSRTLTEGDFSVDDSGNLTFLPAPDFFGTALIQYSVLDLLGNDAGSATVTINIDPVNDAPLAADDATSTNENTPVSFDVTANDTDIDGTIEVATVDLNLLLPGVQTNALTLQGTFDSDGAGNITYTPLLLFAGIATIDYVVSDNSGDLSNTATLTITVNNTDLPPSAVDDSGVTNEDESVMVAVLANDTDDNGIAANSVDLDPLTAGIQGSSNTAEGDFTTNVSGEVSFVPVVDFSGSASVDYVVNDNVGQTSNVATLTITVNSVNDLPIAANDAMVTTEDNPASLNVTLNDADPDGNVDASTVDLNTSVAGIQNTFDTGNGVFSVSPIGMVTYTPDANFFGIDNTLYTVMDDAGGTSNPASINVAVNSVNDPPVAANDVTVTDEDVAAVIDVLNNDSDVDGALVASTIDLDAGTAGIQSSIIVGEGTYSADALGEVTFTPIANFNGVSIVTYTVSDNDGGISNSATITVTVNSVNSSPLAVDDVAGTNEDQPVSFNILSNDTDDLALATATVDLDPSTGGRQTTMTSAGGSFSVNNAGLVTFTPNLNFNGGTSIQYTVEDSEGSVSNTATITVNVADVNDLPVAVADVATTNEDTPVNISVLVNDSDVDGTLNAASVDLDVATAGIQNSVTIASGTYSVNGSGVVTFTPSANFNGSSSIQYNVRDDDAGQSNNVTITVTVTSVNDNPVAVNDGATTDEGDAVSINVVANDTDDGSINAGTVDLDPSTGGIQSTFSNASGSFSVNASGVVTFTPAVNFNGTSVINYTVNDNNGATSNVATITISVSGVNTPPVATNDVAGTNEDQPVSFNILTNDTDDLALAPATVDLDPSTGGRQTTMTSAGGSFSVNNAGLVTFTPNLNFNGGTSIQYTVEDSEGSVSNTATITVNVADVNDLPVAVADVATTNEDTPVSISVLVNDSDVDGTLNAASVDLDVATAGIQNSVTIASGTYSVNGSGVVTFTPSANFNGSSSIQYNVRDDDAGQSNNVTITVTVTSVNDNPVAVNDGATTDEGDAVSINVVANDTDDGSINAATVDLDPSTGGIQSTFSNASGSFSVNASGVVTFTPAVNFNGTSVINYTVNDNNGATSNVATITISVSGVNTPPVAANDVAGTNEDQPVSFNILSNDTDDLALAPATVDLDPSTGGRQTTMTSAGGSFSVNNAGLVTFTPNLNFNGGTSIQYTVEDSEGSVSNTATITVNVADVNDLPVAVADVATTNEDTPVNISVLVNDSDVDGTLNAASVDLDVATAGIQNSVTIASGTYSVNGSGVVTFTPSANFNGSSSIQYNVRDDDAGQSNNVTITVTVTSVNDNPVAVNDGATTDEGDAVSINVVANDTDDGSINAGTVDLDPSTGGIQSTFSNASGSFSVNASGVVTFTPAVNFNGTSVINYTVNDNNGATSNVATITISVSGVNTPPVATNDVAGTNEDQPVSFNILTNDTDDLALAPATVDLDPSTGGRQTTMTSAGGSFSVNNAGLVTFTPNLNFNGGTSIQYTVEDSEGSVSNTATITVNVADVNDLPVAVADVATTNEDTPVNISVLVNDSDVDGTLNAASVDLDVATAGIQNSVTIASGTYSVNGSGVVTFTPSANFNGSSSIQYNVRDDDGGQSNNVSITVTVSAGNDSPVAVNDVATTNEDTPVNISILANDSDVDGTLNAASVDLDIAAAGIQSTVTLASGTFSVSALGIVTFTPAANFNGTATIQYNVRDDAGAISNNATVTITVSSVNDNPQAVNDTGSTAEGEAVSVNVVANDTDDGAINPATVDLDPSTTGIQSSLTNTSGTFTANASGVVTFTPAANFNGSVAISYTINDNNGATSNIATITITVSSVNAAPVAVNDVVNSNEDQVANVNVLTNDSDDIGLDVASVDLDPATDGRQTSITVAGGSYSVNNSGVVTFTPTLNFNGVTSVQYVVGDTEGAISNTATLTINVADINDAPIAVSDATTTSEDNAMVFNIVSNDSDVDGTINASSVDLDIASAGIQSSFATAAGSWSVNASGLLTFTPVANFNGVASIQYNVRDDDGTVSNNATITVTVNAVNDSPVAVNDGATTNENQAVSVNVLANDSDDNGINPATVDLDPATGGIQSSVSVAAGLFSVSSSGLVTFSPVANFNGPAVINYTVNDTGGLTSNIATITITVNSVNAAPVATNDSGSTNEDVSVTIDVTGNDLDDVGINDASVDLHTGVAGQQTSRTTPQGTYSVDASGNVTFTPLLNFTGSSGITYTVMDDEGATSNVATISITVNPVNDKPVAVSDARTTNEDTPVTINVISNDSDVDGTIVPASVDLDPAVGGIQSSLDAPEGTYTANASGAITYSPANNFFGTSTITYVVSDDQGLVSDAATITVTVTSINDAPIANNDIANTDQGVQISFNVTTNDLDVDGTVNAASVDLNPSSTGIQTTRTIASGTYTVNSSGMVTFVPVSNFSGTSSISYTVSDNAGATSNTASISVLVNFVNQKPIANNDAATTNEDTPVTINILSNDTDDGSIIATTVDLNTTTSGIQTSIATTAGTFTVNNTGIVTFAPALNFNGSSTITYTVNDNIGETSNIANISVTVVPVNDAPVATNDGASTNEDTPAVIKVIQNDTDTDGTIDPTTVDLIPATDEIDRSRSLAQGTFNVNAVNGDVTFTPVANFNGSVSTTYNVRDNNGAKSNNATINITILNVNDPPSFNTIADQRVLKNSVERTITISGITPGPSETEQLVLAATSQNTTLIPHPVIVYNGTAASATLTFKPQLNQSGTAEIVVRALDGGLNEFSRSFIITVVDVDIISTPVTLAFPGEVYEYNIAITEIPETLTFTTIQKPSWMTLTSTGKNTARLSGTPPANAVSSVVAIQLRDGASVIDQQQFTLEVNRRPTSAAFELTGQEDTPIQIGTEPFLLAYSDPDDHPLTEVEITELPRHGTLTLGNSSVSLNQVILLSELPSLVYNPAQNYSGPDTAYFKVKDTFSYSLDPSYFNFVVSPVNDPPVIDAIETEALVHDIGREQAQVFTNLFSAHDPEGDQIVGAVIGFRAPNFNSLHDLLEFSNTSSIQGSYDEETGTLTLTGAASVQEYVDAIRNIKYNFIDLDDIILQSRFLYVTLSDATSTSAPVEREVKLIYDFVELDIPNIFTPDGNGRNDFWRISAATGLQPYNDATIRVFDGRGKLVFETTGFDQPWDGTGETGSQVPEGTYFYVVDLNYGKVQYTGSVTVLRTKL